MTKVDCSAAPVSPLAKNIQRLECAPDCKFHYGTVAVLVRSEEWVIQPGPRTVKREFPPFPEVTISPLSEERPLDRAIAATREQFPRCDCGKASFAEHHVTIAFTAKAVKPFRIGQTAELPSEIDQNPWYLVDSYWAC